VQAQGQGLKGRVQVSGISCQERKRHKVAKAQSIKTRHKDRQGSGTKDKAQTCLPAGITHDDIRYTGLFSPAK